MSEKKEKNYPAEDLTVKFIEVLRWYIKESNTIDSAFIEAKNELNEAINKKVQELFHGQNSENLPS